MVGPPRCLSDKGARRTAPANPVSAAAKLAEGEGGNRMGSGEQLRQRKRPPQQGTQVPDCSDDGGPERDHQQEADEQATAEVALGVGVHHASPVRTLEREAFEMSGKKVLAITPELLGYGVIRGNVVVILGYQPEQLGLPADTQLALEMTPSEARQVAQSLLAKAALAEAQLLRPPTTETKQ